MASRRWRRAGLRRNAVYLVRPDGYVGLADAEGGATAIASYLDARKIIACDAMSKERQVPPNASSDIPEVLPDVDHLDRKGSVTFLMSAGEGRPERFVRAIP